MNPTIVATLPDHEYGMKFRHRRYSLNPRWLWGLGADGQLYCRDDSVNSIFTGEWFVAEDLQLGMDVTTIHKLSRWISSFDLKSKVKSLADKEAMSMSA